MGGTSDPEINYGLANLVSLCRDCHSWIHLHPAESYESGWLVHSWDDPAEIPLQPSPGMLIKLDHEGRTETSTLFLRSGMDITVRGIPAPQGSKRHVGGGRMIESSRAVGPWREAVRAETQRVAGAVIEGPVAVSIIFRLPRPRHHYGTGRNAGILRDSAPAYPSGKPDLDKLERAVLDGITTGGAWRDDAQVIHLSTWKVYASRGFPAGCEIEITEVNW